MKENTDKRTPEMKENVSGNISSKSWEELQDYEKLLAQNKERIKELAAINETSRLIKESDSIENTFRRLCGILQRAYQYPEFTVSRIVFNGSTFSSVNFKPTQWSHIQNFETVDRKTGQIEVYYLKEFPKLDEGPFLKEERDLLKNISSLLTGYLNSLQIAEYTSETRERLKELACINKTTHILREGKAIEDSLLQISNTLPQAWQYPEFTASRITFNGTDFKSNNFKETRWYQKENFETIDAQTGSIEIFYLQQFPDSDEGPFLDEERALLKNITSIISGYLNSVKGKNILNKTLINKKAPEKEKAVKEEPLSRQLLQNFLNKNNYDRDIYHDLMPFKVKDILLVANLYDAYSIEREGRFSEHVLEEYSQLNLTSIPRITGVSSPEEAMAQLHKKHFDMVIIMVGVDKKSPVGLSCKIKKDFPYIPVFLLLNNNSDLEIFERKNRSLSHVDKVFIWNGESKVFFAMIKHVEDKINLENDTNIGMVRVIMLVEDSAKYYSRYLPLLYKIVMEQTKRMIDDVSTDELYRVLKLRVRPKIILCSSFEEAISIFNKYKDYLLCLISDIKFNRGGTLDDSAGIKLVKYIRSQIPGLPTILQSSDPEKANTAYELKATFIEKNSESLNQDFESFIMHYLGFGNFIYKDPKGNPIAVARSLKEFEKNLRTIPDETLLYHARKNHFSLWLMARGEIQAAKILNPHKVTEFKSARNIREYLISIIQKFRNEQNRGKIIPFEESAIKDESNVISLTQGSLGGKGRGVAFINNLLYNYDFSQHIPNINIRAPKTSVIGTDEFEYFIQRNNLYEQVIQIDDYEEIKELFINARLTDTLLKKLKILLKHIKKPIAVRSSGLFEDSLMQPFAGIFETYILPNNDPNPEERLKQLTDAIKMVYASVYSSVSKSYIQAVNYKLEEEKMAVVIQEVVGNQFGDYFYPHLSGVAQSYNYYPVAHMKPEEGYSVLALGLGKYVVEGEKAYRFSPKYPSTEINSPKDQYKNSQVEFYAVDLKKKNIDVKEGDMAGLARLEIDDAEQQGTLRHCASVYDNENQRIIPGITEAGPRIINFANILKYNYIPLAQTIETVLDVVKEALGSPVEIEFAVDLNKDKDYKASFYLLQIKPLLGATQDFNIEAHELKNNNNILLTDKAMGNGMIRDIYDVIYIDNNKFDKSKTVEMTKEIEEINRRMVKENRKYILIGPGRWGTRDRWIGIPVAWPQISNAKIIVETSMEGYPLDASSGSHFFHNVTSMNVGYFTVQEEFSRSFIKWDILDNEMLVDESAFFKHIRFSKPLIIKMDGKQRIAFIATNQDK